MKEKIKLVALDLDGTLLTTNKELSAENERALRSCIEQGVWIVPCTGRTWAGVPDAVKRIEGIRYAITVNGAVIEDVIDHKVIDTRKLSTDKTVEVMRIAEELGAMYDAYVNGRGISESRFYDHLEDYGITPQMVPMIHATRDVVPHIITKIESLDTQVEKINFFFGDLGKRALAREELKKVEGIIVSSSIYNNLEINQIEATKGDGIIRLASYLGLPKEATMGCGDGENDETMMTLAGLGVAMGNAEPHLKELAGFVTETNDRHGVAAAINRFVLE